MRLKKKTHPVVRFAVLAVIIVLVFGTVPVLAAGLVVAAGALCLYVARRPTPEPEEA